MSRTFRTLSALLCLAVVAAVGICAVVICLAAEPATWTAPPAAVAATTPPSAYAAQANVSAAAAAATATKPAAATKGFKTALNNAASQAYREGAINRWQLARIRMAIAFRSTARPPVTRNAPTQG